MKVTCIKNVIYKRKTNGYHSMRFINKDPEGASEDVEVCTIGSLAKLPEAAS